jgi:hypothetical protein
MVLAPGVSLDLEETILDFYPRHFKECIEHCTIETLSPFIKF